MATIRATCPDHGDINTTTHEVDVIGFGKLDSYRFRCPIGEEVVIKKADERTVNLLQSSGCDLIKIGLPKIDYLPVAHEPISHDDILDFHNALNATHNEIWNNLRN